ncbi:hypothetical protein M2M59_08855 [Rummeliibacillus sp. G93]|uniref:hypothetical protein n=1 Tax=Rummeliibacillus sp. G93 TaxID=2939494 RepID=UPI00201BE1BE|nr:hypothetical protein [Rummeliibacillus sp. G93]UQW96127.1 hypothetical protein M2M59_08855 [Rummeliibacillus sp. G93]
MDNSMDYGLAILKPDGVIKPKVYDSFKRELGKNNLEIVFEKRAQLQKKIFYLIFPLHLIWMSMLIIYLVVKLFPFW